MDMFQPGVKTDEVFPPYFGNWPKISGDCYSGMPCLPPFMCSPFSIIPTCPPVFIVPLPKSVLQETSQKVIAESIEQNKSIAAKVPERHSEVLRSSEKLPISKMTEDPTTSNALSVFRPSSTQQNKPFSPAVDPLPSGDVKPHFRQSSAEFSHSRPQFRESFATSDFGHPLAQSTPLIHHSSNKSGVEPSAVFQEVPQSSPEVSHSRPQFRESLPTSDFGHPLAQSTPLIHHSSNESGIEPSAVFQEVPQSSVLEQHSLFPQTVVQPDEDPLIPITLRQLEDHEWDLLVGALPRTADPSDVINYFDWLKLSQIKRREYYKALVINVGYDEESFVTGCTSIEKKERSRFNQWANLSPESSEQKYRLKELPFESQTQGALQRTVHEKSPASSGSHYKSFAGSMTKETKIDQSASARSLKFDNISRASTKLDCIPETLTDLKDDSLIPRKIKEIEEYENKLMKSIIPPTTDTRNVAIFLELTKMFQLNRRLLLRIIIAKGVEREQSMVSGMTTMENLEKSELLQMFEFMPLEDREKSEIKAAIDKYHQDRRNHVQQTIRQILKPNKPTTPARKWLSQSLNLPQPPPSALRHTL